MTKLTQHQPMMHDPVTNESHPYPSDADEYRKYHGTKAWLYNPWSGQQRLPEDIGTDPEGFGIVVSLETLSGSSK